MTGTSYRTKHFRVQVSLKDNSTLSLEVESLSREALSMRQSSLPWGWRYSTLIKAFETDALGTPLDEIFPIADPPVMDDITLPPGKTLKGEIDLLSRFPELLQTIEKRDVVLFWSYPLPFSGLGEDAKQRLGGWFLLSRRVPKG